MDKQNKYAALALKALERASKKITENAIKNNDKIPFWINGKVEYQVPSVLNVKEQLRR
jgi:ribosomal protein L39E